MATSLRCPSRSEGTEDFVTNRKRLKNLNSKSDDMAELMANTTYPIILPNGLDS